MSESLIKGSVETCLLYYPISQNTSLYFSLLLSLTALSIELQIPIDWLNQFRLVHLQMAQREKHKNKQNRKKKNPSSFTFRAFGCFVIQGTKLSSVIQFRFARFHKGCYCFGVVLFCFFTPHNLQTLKIKKAVVSNNLQFQTNIFMPFSLSY